MGKAEVFDPGGTLLAAVEVALTAPDTSEVQEPWFGTIWGDFDPFDLMEGTPLLRLADGRESTFRLSRTDLVLPRLGTAVVGTDGPPF